MRFLYLSLALFGAFVSTACQSNQATPETSVEVEDDTPSGGLVPGQVDE